MFSRLFYGECKYLQTQSLCRHFNKYRDYSLFVKHLKSREVCGIARRKFMGGRKPSPFLKNQNAPRLTPKVDVIDASPKSIRLLKPLCFTFAFSGLSFSGAAIWQYENMRSKANTLFNEQAGLSFHREKNGFLRQHFNRYWNSLSDGEKVAAGIILLNCLVFIAWKVPSLKSIMITYFASNPASKAVCWPMLFSTFSHYSGLHLFVNMYVLYSFSSGIGHVLGKEQFLATYLSAGVISSFGSYVHKAVKVTSSVSLGASGAIMAVIGMICTEWPDTRLSIIFLPFFTFSAGAAIKGIIAMDSAGLLLGWKMFDHAAHLGGALFGIGYVTHGRHWLWDNREHFMRKWHEFRERTSK